MVSIPFEFIVPYENAALQEDLANMHLKVKSKHNLCELIQRYGYDAVKHRQEKLMKEHTKHRGNKGQVDQAAKTSPMLQPEKHASPHTPGAADSISASKIASSTATTPGESQAIKLSTDAAKAQETPGQPMQAESTRTTAKKQSSRDSQKKVAKGKRDGESDHDYNQRRKRQAKERSQRTMNQSF